MCKFVTFVPAHVAEKINEEEWFHDAVVEGRGIGISIRHPDQEALFAYDEGWFMVKFDDITTPVPGSLMFDTFMASMIADATEGCDVVVVHCEAGMSRSAAVAKWLSDRRGYELWLHPDGIGTVTHYNKHVYRTMDAAEGRDMASYYAEVERMDRMMGK